MSEEQKKVIGFWISERKRQKFNFKEFENICQQEGFILKQVDLNESLESQGPFHVFLHKLTNSIAQAKTGDQHSKSIVNKVQEYILRNPQMIVIDPLENIRTLGDRHKLYKLLHDGLECNDIFVPNSVELKSKSNPSERSNCLKRAGIKYPFICKPIHAHGSVDAHKMMVIFNEKGLTDCQPPCVAQNFINHNAILYKIFTVGNYFHVVERPSFKNFYPKDCETLDTIFFHSHDISKSWSNSKWSVISKDEEILRIKPNYDIFNNIVKKVREIFGLILVGVDVIIENHTGKYGIIDINCFPGYDGYPNFFNHLINVIKLLIDNNNLNTNQYSNSIIKKSIINDELDSGFESDDKKKESMK